MEPTSRADAKLKGLPRAVRDVLWLMRNPMEEGDKMFTYVEILVWLASEHGVQSSPAALTPYYAWEKMNRDIENGIAAAEQAKLEFAMKYPDASAEKLREVGQLVFTTKTMQADNLDGWVKLQELWERRQERLLRKEQWDAKKEAAARKQAAEDEIRKVSSDKTMTAEERRAAVIDKMDEFFGLTKKH